MFHGFFWPFWFFWPFHGLLTLILVIVLLVVLFRHHPAAPYPYPAGKVPPSTPGTPPVAARSEALAILEARYARGEIQRDEYLQKKADLGG